MLVYSNTKRGFVNDVLNGNIADKVEDELRKQNIYTSQNEFKSWQNSLHFMKDVIDDGPISDDCPVAIEYRIPVTSRRVDFLIGGKDSNDNNNIIVVELKQWTVSEITDQPDIVETYLGHENKFVPHPSYQAYSYAKTIECFNESIEKYKISLKPCAYLHNYLEKNRDKIDNKFYKEVVNLAPVFIATDRFKIKNFIEKYIKRKSEIDLLHEIDNGRIKPTKSLIDTFKSLLEGNQEFYLIDEQKVVYERIKKILKESYKHKEKKYTIIVEGGAGTGKSVIAIQLLSDLLTNGKHAIYCTKTDTMRKCLLKKLTKGKYTKKYVESCLKGSTFIYECCINFFDAIICDEAHRLVKVGMGASGKDRNQVREIIKASKVSIFFIDEKQKVRAADIGTIKEIENCAKLENSEIVRDPNLVLKSQFRCNGSDEYIDFLDELLYRNNENYQNLNIDLDLRLFNSPTRMRDELRLKNFDNKARIVAGYCYDWITEDGKNKDQFDINLEDDFHAKRNFDHEWAIKEGSFEEVGCFHTSQGVEFNYVGVIIGKDLRYENGKVITDYNLYPKKNKALVGAGDNEALKDEIIRNTYRVLLTRGMKGCYIYCEDKALLKHISEMTGREIEY